MLTSMYKTLHYFHHKHPHPPGHSNPQDRVLPGRADNNARKITIVRKVLDVNDTIAEQNRQLFAEKGVYVLNVMSSPGSGKTSTLEKTLLQLTPEIRCAVIVGDICTSNDADRLAASGIPVVQVNTDAFGGDCHLAAHIINTAANNFDLNAIDLLIVENLGNLVCPAEFDLGEDLRVVVLSVTEGEDKPLKYPLMFRVCDAVLLNKIDLLPHLDYDITETTKNILQIHPDIPVFEISAKTQAGFGPWMEWLRDRIRRKLK